jgi:hypothetical protein
MGVKNPYTPAPYPTFDAGDDDMPPEVKAQYDYARSLDAQAQPTAEPEAQAPGIRIPYLNRTISGSLIDRASPALLSALRSRGPAVRAGRGHDLANVASVVGQAFLGARVSGAQDRARAHAEDLALAKEQRGNQQDDRAKARTSAASMLASWRHEKNRANQPGGEPKTMVEIPGVGPVPATSGLARQYLTASGKVSQPPSANNLNFDPVASFGRIVAGLDPPVASGYSRGQWGQMTTAGAKHFPKFNLARAQNTWVATNTFTKSLNGRQQVQLHNSAAAVMDVLPSLKKNLDELDRLAPTTDATPLNNLLRGGTVAWGANGPRAQALAQQIITQMASIQPELANVYSAGGVPTDKAQALVEKTFNLSIPVRALKAGIDTESDMLNIRVNAIANAQPTLPGGPGQANPYVPEKVGDVPLPNDPGAARDPQRMDAAAADYELKLTAVMRGTVGKTTPDTLAALETAALAAHVPADTLMAIKMRVTNNLPRRR